MLTVYAAIVLPLSLITSWYGMNVSNLPASDNRWGWVVVTGIMAAIAVGSWALFVRVGIIRRPDFGGNHRLVRGLSSAARAPVRSFAMVWRPSTVLNGTSTLGVNGRLRRARPAKDASPGGS